MSRTANPILVTYRCHKCNVRVQTLRNAAVMCRKGHQMPPSR